MEGGDGGRRWKEEEEGVGRGRKWRGGGGRRWRWRLEGGSGGRGWREGVEGRGGRRRCPNDLEALFCSVCPNTKVLDVSNLEKVPFVVQNEEFVHETHSLSQGPLPSSSICLVNIDVIRIKPLSNKSCLLCA